MKWRIVQDQLAPMFGVDVEIDEKAFIDALSAYIKSLQDKYHPERDVIVCNLVPDSASFRVRFRPKGD